jgi:AcrR family transcriptional regulator
MHRTSAQYGEGVSRREDYQRVERELLRAARHLIRDDGFQELTMSRLAERAGLSRKTVYNHFANIEDVVVALSIQSVERRADLAARAAQFRGRSRERMAGIGSVIRELLPYHMRHELLLSAIKIGRVPEDRQRRLRSLEGRLLAISTGVIRDAVAAGDLDLALEPTPEQLSLTLLQIECGPVLLSLRGHGVGGYSGETSREVFADTLTLLLDDLGWRPLSTELNYLASIRRMWRELFPDLLEKFGRSA